MKKIISLILVLVMCFCVFCSCTNTDEGAPDGMKIVESSDKLTYKMYIPAHWVQDLSTGVVSAYVSNSDLSNVSMTQFNLEEMKKLDEFVSDYTKELEENLNSFTMSEGYPQNTMLDGVEARKIEYTANLVGNEYKYMQIICVNGSTIYYFTYTALADNFDTHTEDVQKILDNFFFNNK